MIERLVSGGQTGVDRGALDAGIEAGLPVGGWCPKGRRAEDGEIPPAYPMRETETNNYLERTEANVRDSDGTLILAQSSALTGGTAATKRFARAHAKPCLVMRVDDGSPAALKRIHEWLEANEIGTLNVAGPRESGAPGIQDKTQALMRSIFQSLPSGQQAD